MLALSIDSSLYTLFPGTPEDHRLPELMDVQITITAYQMWIWIQEDRKFPSYILQETTCSIGIYNIYIPPCFWRILRKRRMLDDHDISRTRQKIENRKTTTHYRARLILPRACPTSPSNVNPKRGNPSLPRSAPVAMVAVEDIPPIRP